VHHHGCCTCPITLSRGSHCCQDLSSRGQGEIPHLIAMSATSQGLQVSTAWEIPRVASDGRAQRKALLEKLVNEVVGSQEERT